jgi:formate dehydrogenase subunit delta
MKTETLVRMANQIAQNFGAYPLDQQTVRIGNHLKSFWEPSMLDRLLDYANEDGSGLEQSVKNATQKFKKAG